MRRHNTVPVGEKGYSWQHVFPLDLIIQYEFQPAERIAFNKLCAKSHVMQFLQRMR